MADIAFLAIGMFCALFALLVCFLCAPILNPRPRRTKPADGYRMTPEIEKARQIDKTRVDKLKDERG